MKKAALILSIICWAFIPQAFAQPVAGFTYAFTNGGCTSDSVVFSNTSTGADVYMWEFGDFTPPVFTLGDTSHWYTWDNAFVVTLTAYDTVTGDSDLFTDFVIIGYTPFPGWAWFFPQPNNPVCLGNEVEFTSFMFPAPTSVIWDFGDGDSLFTIGATHTYADTGTYVVTLIASTSCGSDTYVDTVIVDANAPPPQFPWFWAFPDPACPGTAVSFTNGTWPPPLTTVYDFGDGDSAFTYDASHAYAATGTYYTSLTVDNGCNDTTIFDSIVIDNTIIPSVFACPVQTPLISKSTLSTFKVSAVGSVTGPPVFELQPLLSVTVTLYVPPLSPIAVALV